MEAVGTVTFAGVAGDSGAGWAVGFLQAQWIETNWAIYRGQHQTDGSIFVQRARPPARSQQACFDCIGPTVRTLYGTAASPPTIVPATGGPPLPLVASLPASPAFPLTVSVIHRDFPQEFYPFTRTNHTTGQTNGLYEVQLEFAFCFSLVVKDAGGRFQFLHHLYWNLNWQYRFAPAVPPATPVATPVASSNTANIGNVIPGQPTDRRFLPVLTTPQTTNCNAIALAALNNPNIRESSRWENFDVKR
jgi:hypothetical protein